MSTQLIQPETASTSRRHHTAPPFPVPDRMSSLAALERRQLIHRASRNELKRKISAVGSGLNADSHDYIRLKIDEVELDKEEQQLVKIELAIEKTSGNLDARTYRAKRRETEKRIFSLGDELWQLKRSLRVAEEQAGKIVTLTPDSDNAFTAALLHLYKDPATSRKRSRAMQGRMRTEAIQAYDAHAREGEKMEPGKWLRCALSRAYYDSAIVKAAHVVPSSVGVELAGYIFGPEAGARIFSADNCLLLHSQIEVAFDNGNLIFIPLKPDQRPIRRWKAIITNDDARQQEIRGVENVTTLGQLDGQELEFRTSHRPAARFLYYHFIVTLLRCRQYERAGWQDLWDRVRTGQPWPTPGPYFRKSMLLALARAADDVNGAEIEGLVSAHTFEASERLPDDAEEEVARRSLVAGLQRQERAEKVDRGEDIDDETTDDDEV